jgi:activating signal cointegrator complex subunit 3
MDYLTWTYFYRRLVMNPSFYGLEDVSEEGINMYLSELVEDSVWQLSQSGCVTIGEDGLSLEPDTLGRIASYYYLDHKTLRLFSREMREGMNIPELLQVCRGFVGFPEV